MPRPTVAKDAIDRAALRLFAERGVAGTSIKDIAEAAGVSQGAMYRHYATKEEMARHLFLSNYADLAQRLDDICAERSGFRARVAGMVAEFCTLFDADEELFRFLLLVQHEHLPALTKGLRTPVDVLVEVMAEAMEAGAIPRNDPNLKAAAAMGIVLQAATFRVYGRITGAMAALADSLTAACIAAAEA